MVEGGFAEDGTAGIAGAEKKYVHGWWAGIGIRLVGVSTAHAGAHTGVHGFPPQQFSVRNPNRAFIVPKLVE
jgi:hypothetical protein